MPVAFKEGEKQIGKDMWLSHLVIASLLQLGKRMVTSVQSPNNMSINEISQHILGI